MSVASMVRDARLGADLTMGELAALSGVAESVVSGIESGATAPSAETYLRLLRAAGFADGGGRLQPLCDPSAIWVARWLLGDLPDRPAGARAWCEAWEKLGLIDHDGTVKDPESLAFRAGRAARLALRPHRVTFSGEVLPAQAARLFDEARVDYAITGDEALERLGGPIIPSWPVFYVSDFLAADRALGLRQRIPGEIGPVVTILCFDGASEKGRQLVGDLWFASPLQVIIDGYGGYGRMVDQSEFLVKSWIV